MDKLQCEFCGGPHLSGDPGDACVAYESRQKDQWKSRALKAEKKLAAADRLAESVSNFLPKGISPQQLRTAPIHLQNHGLALLIEALAEYRKL